MDWIGYLRRIMNRDAAETFDPATDSLEAISNALGIGPGVGLWMFGRVAAGIASTTVITTDNLGVHLPTDVFNNEFYMQVLHNFNAPGTAPEREIRRITDFVGPTQTFTTDAFSANVEAGDLVAIIHESILSIEILGFGTLTTSSATVPADNTRAEVDNYFNGCLLMPTEGACRFQPRRIVDYTGATGVFTLDPNNPFTGVSGLVDYIIIGDQTEFVPAVDGTNNRTPSDVIGGKADTPSDDPDVNTLSLMRLLKSLMRAWKCVIPNIDVSLAAIDNVLTTDPSAGAPDAENTIMDLPITAGTMYKLEDIIIKVSSYGTGAQITIRVWELLGGDARANYVNTHTVVVPTDYPITTHLTLVDITGKPAIVGDGIAITAITDAGNTGALTCTYTYSTARVS